MLGRLGGGGGVRGSDPDRPFLIVIDPQPEAGSALESLLTPICQVLSFQLPAAAINAIDEATAVVLLDVGPKGRDGMRVFEAILTKNRHLPVIFLTPYQDPRDPSDPLYTHGHRPFACFSKGGDPRLLLDIVDRAVKYSRAITDIKRLVLKVQGVQENMQKSKVREP